MSSSPTCSVAAPEELNNKGVNPIMKQVTQPPRILMTLSTIGL